MTFIGKKIENRAAGNGMRALCGGLVGIAALVGAAGPASAQVGIKTETIEYHDDPGRWVLGQVKRTTTNGIETGRTEFDANARPWKTYTFGKLQQTLTYNTDGTVATAADGAGNTIALSSWYRGIPRTIQHPATQDQPSGVSESAEVDDNGWVTAVVDENGYATGYGHDAMGRVASLVPPIGDSTAWNTQFSSFTKIAAGDWMPPGIGAGQWKHMVWQGNYRKITYYDAMWRPLLIHEYDTSNTAATLKAVSQAYDTNGRTVFQSYPSSDLIPAATGTWSFYDVLDRPIQVKQDWEGSGQLTTTTEYLTGFQTRVTNPRGFQTVTQYQAFDTPSYDAPTGISELAGRYTEIYRDVFGKLTALRRRNGDGSQSDWKYYVYDIHQQLCKSIESETGATVMAYDGAGNLTHTWAGLSLPDTANCNHDEVWSSGRLVWRRYNARNQVDAIRFADGRGDQNLAYTPDGLLSQIVTFNEPNGLGQVNNVYTYNKRRLLTGDAVGQPNWYSWGLGYGYDANGSLTNQTYPTGLVVSYAPNALGQATAVTDSAGRTHASGIAYYPNGAISQFTYGNGIVHTMQQNARQLPVRTTDAGALNYSYAYDNAGNPTHIADDLQGAHYTRWMHYDGLDRLTDVGSCSFGGDCWHRFTYDALDNMKSWKLAGVKDYANYVYDASNRLTLIQNTAGAGIVGLGYDAQGNLSNKNGQAYSFDFGNRLRETAGKRWYRYDGHGRRIINWPTTGVHGDLSQYSRDGKLIHIADYTDNPAGNISKDHIYLAGSLLSIVEYPHVGGPQLVKYQHTDALGSPVAVTNEAGAVIDRTQWEPYGAAIGKPAYDGIGYTGHVMDGATGLTYMQQRYYDPGIGRFLSVDPVTAYEKPGMNFNRYWYANNNPYKFMDPDGRFGVVGAGIGAAIDFGTQMAMSEGSFSERLSNVNWSSVGVSAAVGAVTGGVGGVLGKAAVSGAITTTKAVAATAAVGGATSAAGKVAEGALTGKGASPKDVAVAAAAGAAGSGAGAKVGLSAVAKVESMAASNSIAGHIGRTTQGATQQGGKVVEPSTSAGQKAGQTAIDTAASYSEKNINK